MSQLSIEICPKGFCGYDKACARMEDMFDINGCTISQHHLTGLPEDASFDLMYDIWIDCIIVFG